MKKVMSIFGTRPEAIKMAPVILELKKQHDIISKVCVTAQHRELLDAVLHAFNIEPDYDLDIMKHGQTLEGITQAILQGLQSVFEKEKPDLILVHGDTTTTFAAALCAYYHHILIGHIEAGLRTYQKYSPFPEEMNRQMVGRLTDLHFAPTEISRHNLIKENILPEHIFVTGNTAIDALQYTTNADYKHEYLTWSSDSRLLLLTAHRRENQGEDMANIFRAIKQLVNQNPDVKVLYPCHPNPKIQKLAHEILDQDERIRIVPPLEVFDFHNILRRSYLVLSDSGGIQEEAPSLGKPVLVLRNTTERPEGVRAGTLRLVGTSIEGIVRNAQCLLDDMEEYEKMSKAKNPYGDGKASKRIVDAIHMFFQSQGSGNITQFVERPQEFVSI